MLENNSVIPSRAKNQTSEKASLATGKAALAAIRVGLDSDAMAGVWNDKLSATQKNGLWLVAGLDGCGYLEKWRFITEREKEKLKKVISTFAGLAVRIKGAVS